MESLGILKLNRRGANGGEEEDRLSALPDELIHHILSLGVKLNDVVKTCTLSKRWLTLWSTFPTLNFTPLRYILRNDAKYVEFITKFLLARAPRVETCSVHIDLRESELDKSVGGEVLLTLHHAVSQSLEKLCMSHAKLDSYLSFPVLTELTLDDCNVSFTKWSLPCLTTLELHSVCFYGAESMLCFKEFQCLKELCLGGCCGMFMDLEFVRIDPPNLESLFIYQGHGGEIPGCKFVISTPKLKCFKFVGRYVPVVSVEGGFPCLEQAWFNIYLGKGELASHRDAHWYYGEDYSWEMDENQVNEIMLKITNLFREFRETKALTLFPETIEFLSRIPNFCKYRPSPFVNLKSLYLRGHVPQRRSEYPSSSNNHVIKYLLSNSPGAEFIIQHC